VAETLELERRLNSFPVIRKSGPLSTHAINSARSRIWIYSPCFVPDESVVSALKLALLRGVDVCILIPDGADHYLESLAVFSFLNKFNGCYSSL